MPWTIEPRRLDRADAPAVCEVCRGSPPDSGDGTGRCVACGAILVSPDPGPNEVFRLTLVPCDAESRPLRRRARGSIQVEWGERTQADGTVARVYRLIDREHDRYVEKVKFADGTVFDCDEPLREHRGHGSARGKRGHSDGQHPRRRWIAF